MAAAQVLVNLRLTIAPDGSAQMDGAILVVSATDAPIPLDDGGRPVRLVATGADAQASCAAANGNGQPGIVRVVADFRDARSGERVPVVLETAPGQDIDERGVYPLALTIGDERLMLDARVALGPVRRRQRRRRGRWRR